MTPPENPRMGARVRALRRREQLTQVQLAEKLGISASYLNLIEANRRPLTAPLLIKLAGLFKVDLQQFAPADDARLANELFEVFGDPLFEDAPLMANDARELATANPNAARSILRLYNAYQESRANAENLAGRLTDGDELQPAPRHVLPSEEVSEVLQANMNHFPALEQAAEQLHKFAHLEPDDLYRGLTNHLRDTHGVAVQLIRSGPDDGLVRKYDPDTRTLYLTELMAPRTRNFHCAHQVGLLLASDAMDRIAQDRRLTSDDSRKLMRVALANYFAGAVIMPYAAFLEAARSDRYDIELLGHRFRSSFEQVSHRITTLRRPGAEGVPFHMIRIDIAGNISKRFSASGIHFARFSGACPRWNIFSAFMTPGLIRIQLSKMTDGAAYFCLARTLSKARGGYHAQHPVQAIGLGCRVEHAKELVYSDGVDLEDLATAVPVGVTCRLCDRVDCQQRAFPSIQRPLRVDENVRTLSFYEPAPHKV